MKKRSLFVATAMLLVAVLVATGATYAWFNGSNEAEANIVMKVSGAEVLEMQVNGQGPWYTSLDNNKLGIDTTEVWKDFSVTDDGFATPSFYYDEYTDGSTEPTSFALAQTTGLYPQKVTIKFRALQQGNVAINTSSLLNAYVPGNQNVDNAELTAALRLGIQGTKLDNESVVDLNQIFAKDAVQIEDAIAGTTTSAKGEQNALDINAQTNFVYLGTQDGEYYTGEATFYFWVEGTECDNTMVEVDNEATAELDFILVTE